jgi:hypothetical protein
MQRPRVIPGYCPFYDEPSSVCYLSENYQDGGHRDYSCKSDTHCKTCGNYEAWASGNNYRDK